MLRIKVCGGRPFSTSKSPTSCSCKTLPATEKKKMTVIKQILKGIILTLIFSLTLTSCSKVFLGIYGMKNISHVDEKVILKYGKKYNIPKQDSYELDTSYFSFLFSLDTIKYKSQIKNHYQPLQALYYDKDGYLRSFHINCYAGGFPNLKWDRNEIFSTFLPKEQAPIDSIVTLDTQLKYLQQLSQTEKFSIDSLDYIIIVYWNRFMGRQSKRLIKFVQENEKLAIEKKVKIIYVNTDNLFNQEE